MKKIFYGLITYILMLCACEKPDTTPPYEIEPCTPLPACASGFGWEYIFQGKELYYPYFNPNNSDEFLYAELVSGQGFFIYKYNLKTQVKMLICTTNLFSSPKWSRKDWIVFSASDYNVWKVKSNGDSLIKITNSGNYIGAAWNYSGTAIITNILNKSALMLDENGNAIDTLNNTGISPIGCQFISDNQALMGVFIYDLMTYSYSWKANTLEEDYGYGDWDKKSNRVIWANNKHIYATSLSDKKHTLLKEFCNSMSYQLPSINKAGTTILWSKTVFTPDSSNFQLFTKRLIVKTDIDGRNEQVIEVP